MERKKYMAAEVLIIKLLKNSDWQVNTIFIIQPTTFTIEFNGKEKVYVWLSSAKVI